MGPELRDKSTIRRQRGWVWCHTHGSMSRVGGLALLCGGVRKLTAGRGSGIAANGSELVQEQFDFGSGTATAAYVWNKSSTFSSALFGWTRSLNGCGAANHPGSHQG